MNIVSTPKTKDKSAQGETSAANISFHPSANDNEGKTRKKKTEGKRIRHIDRYLDDWKEATEFNEKRCRITAWELNKEVYPREPTTREDVEEFFKECLTRSACLSDHERRYFLVDSGASFGRLADDRVPARHGTDVRTLF